MIGIAWWICGAAALGAAGWGLALWRREHGRRLALERWNRDLCGINADLERQLSAQSRDLNAAVELAEAASQAKSEFLANMSHEIRTPLNAVIGLSEVVLRTELSEFQRDHLQTVQESGDALLHVINDILDFSKIEAGKLEVESLPFELEEAVCDALKSLAIRAQSRHLELACLVDAKAPRVIRGDPARFRQVLVNLVNNAITYTEHGEVFVRVTYEAPRSRLHVAVLDSGVGIPPEKLEHVFDAFQQADSSSTRRYGGTGLGLTICRELVDLMGGEIRAASELGIGSTFSFELPVEAVPESAEAREREAGWIAELAGARVLVVDDNSTHRTLMAELLRSLKAEPVLAASAAEGFDRLLHSLFSGEPIWLVVSDVQMPDEDGYSFAERVRSHPQLRASRIVLLTSALEDTDAERRAQLGGVARLMKPVKHSELLDALTAASRRERIAPRRSASAAARRERAPDTAPRILLVEDSPANQKLVLAVLGECGYRIDIADDGSRALAAIGREDFDVVLMDVQMPEMDGYEATRQIRKAEGPDGRRVPIVAMTANALHGDREKCLAAGMDDYLAKPIRRDELLRTVERLVGDAGDPPTAS